MELRKLQLVGRASFSVTLPSDQITITQEEDVTIIRDIHMIAECGKDIAEITIDNSITEKGSPSLLAVGVEQNK